MKKIIRICFIVSAFSLVSACCTLDWGTSCSTTTCCSNANRCCGASSWF